VGSKSSTKSENRSRESTVNNVDNRTADGSIGGNVNLNLSELQLKGGVGVGDQSLNIDISTTDFGALDAASDIADQSISAISMAQSSVNAAVSGAVDAVKDIAANATQDEGARTTQLVIIAGAVVFVAVIVVAVRKRK